MQKYMVKVDVNAVVVISADSESDVKSKSLNVIKEFVEGAKSTHPSIKLEVSQYPSITELPQEVKNA